MYELISINKEEYGEFYGLLSSEKLPFASPEYIEICEKYYVGFTYLLYKIVKSNKVVAILPIIRSKKYLKTIT